VTFFECRMVELQTFSLTDQQPVGRLNWKFTRSAIFRC